jgi:hypothetical protein
MSSGWAAARWTWSPSPSTANGAATPTRPTACWPGRLRWLAATGCCLVSYRAIGGLAVYTHERQAYGDSLGDEECAALSAILGRLQGSC